MLGPALARTSDAAAYTAGYKSWHNGWIMIEWRRSSATSRFSVLAQGAVCDGCHVGAKRTDYVFTRDRNQ